ncbi:BCNT-domain-containing protein [Plenodomus tracheiphilus IPT5]|uniref:SWR1-complex protein 5 n=1 Tax=Plenodomus tracheiphilus IPT5 TaxID=1408161 RepID=A0A6A7AUX0_9PLEO|nr:BCNT-domain-containing protein [Plenodomus tracheiphilus IPT5]
MAPRDFEDDVDNADEKYHESSDEDFNPESAPAEDVSSSEDEDEQVATRPVPRQGKRKAPDDEELDSGDEVTIQAARKKRPKKTKKTGGKDANDELVLSEDEGGEGGLIKTRAQRRGEQKERRPLARTEGATVDVDALWAQMTTAPLQPLRPSLPQETPAPKDKTTTTNTAPPPTDDDDQIPIRKIYTFAGQDTTEEKSIPRSHLPKYISDGWKPLGSTTTTTTPPISDPQSDLPPTTATPAKSRIRRPLRRPTRFDPNPTGYVRALAPEHQLFWPRQHISSSTATTTAPHDQDNATTMAPPDAPTTTKPQKATKLNVVDKSRMDWTGFVDKEGIAEELDTHGKTKEAYLGRMEFLAGVEARREEERLNAKMKGASAAVVQ